MSTRYIVMVTRSQGGTSKSETLLTESREKAEEVVKGLERTCKNYETIFAYPEAEKLDAKRKDRLNDMGDSKKRDPVLGTTFKIQILPLAELSGVYDTWKPKLLQERRIDALEVVQSAPEGKYNWVF